MVSVYKCLVVQIPWGMNSNGGILNSLMVTNTCAGAASPLRSGHPGVQEEAEASEDPHAGRHREDRHGRRLQDCQRHAHDDLRANRSAESAPPSSRTSTSDCVLRVSRPSSVFCSFQASQTTTSTRWCEISSRRRRRRPWAP